MNREEIPDEWISGKLLKDPKIVNGRIVKGAIILSQIDYILQCIPSIKDYFYTIERRAWRGLNESRYADIKLVEDLSLWDETTKRFPNAVCLDIGPADFVDTDSFFPIKDIEKKYTGIQISSWDNYKRPLLFLSACAILSHRRFIKIGHFVKKGNQEEIILRDKCLSFINNSNANVDSPYGFQDNNDLMPRSKEEMNKIINSSYIGILTSEVEGINRFKMECLSANIPFLVAEDAAYPTKKHINELTGALFKPTPEGLAKAIEELMRKRDLLCPREYILKNTGKNNSLIKLKGALKKLTERDKQEFHFEEIEWDGRNNSLIWGREKVFSEIRKILKKCGSIR